MRKYSADLRCNNCTASILPLFWCFSIVSILINSNNFRRECFHFFSTVESTERIMFLPSLNIVLQSELVNNDRKNAYSYVTSTWFEEVAHIINRAPCTFSKICSNLFQVPFFVCIEFISFMKTIFWYREFHLINNEYPFLLLPSSTYITERFFNEYYCSWKNPCLFHFHVLINCRNLTANIVEYAKIFSIYLSSRCFYTVL